MKGLRRYAAILILAATAPSVSSTARAARDKRPPLLILRVEAEKIDPELVTRLDEAAHHQALESLSQRVFPIPALDVDSMRVAAGCVDLGPTCLASIGSTMGAGLVLRMVATGVGRDARIAFQLVRVRDRKIVVNRSVSISDFDASAMEEFRSHVARVLGDPRPAALASVVLVTSDRDASALEEVELYVDDNKWPTGGLSGLQPGDHRIEVHRVGYRPFHWSGTLRPGRETRILVEFEPDPRAADGASDLLTLEPSAADSAARGDALRLDPSARGALGTSLARTESPSVLYAWVFAGSSLVATGVGIGFWAWQEDLQKRATTGCSEMAERSKVCRNGQLTEIGTYVAFSTAGVLGAAAIASFVLEGGLDSVLSATKGSTTVSGGIGPTPGGFGAALTARY